MVWASPKGLAKFTITDPSHFSPDPEMQAHVLQVVVNPDEHTADVYTFDKKHMRRLQIGEGRFKATDIEFDTSTDGYSEDAVQPVFGRPAQDKDSDLQQENVDLKRKIAELQRQLELSQAPTHQAVERDERKAEYSEELGRKRQRRQ